MPRERETARAERVEYYPYTPREWPDVELLYVVVTRDDDDTKMLYWPVRAYAEGVLHINSNGQIAKLLADHKTRPLMRKFKVPTTVGARESWYLAHDGFGAWAFSINPARIVDERQRRKLQETQAVMMRVLNDVLFGGVQPRTLAEIAPPAIARTQRVSAAQIEPLVLSLEERIGHIERSVYGAGVYVGDLDEPGVLSIPISVDEPGTYVVRVRLHAAYAPEVIAVERETARERE